MAIRESIRALLSDLTSDEERVQGSALVVARLVLEQSFHRHCAEFVAQDASLRKDLPSDYLERRLAQIHHNFQSLLPEIYLDLTLTQEESDSIVDVLLRLLQGPPDLAKSAAWALSDSADLSVVPRLAETVRRYAAVDGMLVGQACFAIANILGTIDSTKPMTADQEQLITDAWKALDYTAAVGVEGTWSARDAAQEALQRIRGHFGRGF